MSASCPQCRTTGSLEPLDARYAAELGGILCNYLLCSGCKTISREVRKHERLIGTAFLIPMFVVALGGGAVGSYLWLALQLHAKAPLGFLLTAFTLQGGAAFACATIVAKLRLLHFRPRIIPIGELRSD